LSWSCPAAGRKASRDASYRVPAAPGSSNVSASETSGTPAAPAGAKDPHQSSNEIGRVEELLILRVSLMAGDFGSARHRSIAAEKFTQRFAPISVASASAVS